MRINICLASDENYINYMATAIVSILKTAKKEDDLHVYILCNQVSEKSKNYIQSLNKFKKFEVTFLDMDINAFKDFPKGGPHISNTTYFRYKIAELIPNISQIIYLDCDIIVKQSLADLFSTDLTGYYLAGVEDVGYYYWRNHEPAYIYKEGFYINAGMLVINLDEWRKNKLFDKLVDFTVREKDKIAIGDQDVINQVCFNKIKPLDYKWNVQDSFYRAEPERAVNPNCKKIIEAAENPSIIHYTYVNKPWNNLEIPRAYDWLYFNFIKLGLVKGSLYAAKRLLNECVLKTTKIK